MEEGILCKYQFVYIVGGKSPVGGGKTSLMYYLTRPYMTPPLVYERLGKIRKYIETLYTKGYKNAAFPEGIQCPVYVVGDSFTTYDHDPFQPITTNELAFERIRLPDGTKREDDERILPHSIICIPDLANYVDSRDFNTDAGPDKQQRKFLALRRKIGIRVIADGQNYDGSDKRWRQMADCIIEILDFKHTRGDFRNLAVTTWQCLKFPGWKAYERYLSTGETTWGEEVTYTHVGDIFGIDVGTGENENCCIDSYAGREFFFDGTTWQFTANVADPKKDDQASMQARCDRMRIKSKEGKHANKEAV